MIELDILLHTNLDFPDRRLNDNLSWFIYNVILDQIG